MTMARAAEEMPSIQDMKAPMKEGDDEKQWMKVHESDGDAKERLRQLLDRARASQGLQPPQMIEKHEVSHAAAGEVVIKTQEPVVIPQVTMADPIPVSMPLHPPHAQLHHPMHMPQLHMMPACHHCTCTCSHSAYYHSSYYEVPGSVGILEHPLDLPHDHQHRKIMRSVSHQLDSIVHQEQQQEEEEEEMESDVQHQLHMLIPANTVSCLLGKRGQAIQEITEASGCVLSIRNPKANADTYDDRLLRIYGTAQNIGEAQRLLVACIRKHRAALQDPNYLDLTGEPVLRMDDSKIYKHTSEALSQRAVGSSKRHKPTPFKWLVENEKVGKIIGHGGSMLSSISRTTGATLHVSNLQDMPPGSSERVVTISGSTVDVIMAAKDVIEAKAGGRALTPQYNGKCGQYFALPISMSGMLIGPNGATARNISDRTGARLQITHQEDQPLGSVNRTLHIQGTPKQIQHAVTIVNAKMRDYQRTLPPEATDQDHVTFRLLLPVAVCSKLLDKRGVIIHEIIKRTGAFARFLVPEDDGETRVCILAGDFDQVLSAQRLILHIIAGHALAQVPTAAPLSAPAPVVAPPRRKRKQTPDATESSSRPPKAKRRSSSSSSPSDSSGRRVVHMTTASAPTKKKSKRTRLH